MIAPLPLLLALAAAPSPAAGPSFDCAKARAEDERLVCAEPRLAALDRDLAEAFGAARRAAPADAERLGREQREWLAARRACVGGPRPADREGRLECVAALYERRLSRLRMVAGTGTGIRGAAIARKAPRLELEVAYPVMADTRAGAAAFNAFFASQARSIAAEAEEAIVGDDAPGESELGVGADAEYEITLDTPRLVVVVTSSYVFTGGAHGMPATTSVTFDLERGRPLRADEIFAAGSGWQAALAGKALAELRGRDREMIWDEEDGAAEENAPKAVAELSSWTFSPSGAVLTFPPYSVAPYAAGQPTVRLGWDALRPFLRKDGPFPPR